MNIKYLGQGKFELKAKNNTIIVDKQIKIGDFLIPGDGEFEISEIQTEIIEGIAVFYTEGLTIAYLDKDKKTLSNQEIERINGVDILIIPVGEKVAINVKQAMGLISQIEPKITIPGYFDDISEFSKLAGSNLEKLDILKISKSQLNEEEHRKIIILSCEN